MVTFLETANKERSHLITPHILRRCAASFAWSPAPRTLLSLSAPERVRALRRRPSRKRRGEQLNPERREPRFRFRDDVAPRQLQGRRWYPRPSLQREVPNLQSGEVVVHENALFAGPP